MVSQRLDEVRERMRRAAHQAQRDPEEIRLMAVTKTRPATVVEEARDAGIVLFGENRVQEAARKYADVTPPVALHLIGHLQRNKAKLVPGLFGCVESIDALKTAEALSHQCESSGTRLDVLVQYNSSGEASKSGYDDPEALVEEAHAIASLPGLQLRGLMTIGPFVSDVGVIADAFSRTYRLYTRLQGYADEWSCTIDTLSMGMTDDFEIAIREGSTQVRIGSALFGAREQPTGEQPE